MDSRGYERELSDKADVVHRKLAAAHYFTCVSNQPRVKGVDEYRSAISTMSRSDKQHARRRIQYGALPYRLRGESRPQVMLVTSRETGRWIIPKGWPQKRKNPSRSAAREAREEAGILGKIERDPIGSYSYRKRLKNGEVVACEVRVFPMQVKRQLARWPEQAERQARWFSPSAAARKVQEPALRQLIRTLQKRR